MANTLLTPTAVTREALRILHQELNFVGSIDRQYDDSFGKDGAKIGDTLKIRLPNQYTVRSGATLSAQDTTESSVSLQVATQKGVDVNFTSVDLALSLDDFSKRILAPAMSVLAANIEADAMAMYKDVNQSVWASGATTMAHIGAARTMLQRSLAPTTERTANLNNTAMQDLVTANQSLFNPNADISKQYREGYVAKAYGFDFMDNSLWANHTRGDANTSYVCNTSTGITSGTATITLSTGSGTIKKGDVFTIAGVYSVHPESKANTGVLQQFVATADGTTSVAVFPTPVTSGATQNVNIVGAGAGKAVVVAGTASTDVGTSLLYHREAFAFATADLPMPKGIDFAAREVFDGISLRIVRNYDIVNDKFPCRIDVLYGYKTIRPQLAARLHTNNVV